MKSKKHKSMMICLINTNTATSADQRAKAWAKFATKMMRAVGIESKQQHRTVETITMVTITIGGRNRELDVTTRRQ